MAEPGQLIRSLSGRQAARNFHSFVITEIGMGVASGTFPVGSVLPGDAEMIDRYGVSRTVLREALKTLEAKGLVEARAKVGTRVLPRSRWNLFDRQVLFWIFHAPPDPEFAVSLCEMRRVIELQAAALACERRQAEQMRMMRYWLAQHEMAVDMAEGSGLAAFEIHRMVAEATHNALQRAATGIVEFGLAVALRAQIATASQGFGAEKAPIYERLVTNIEAGRSGAAVADMAAILSADEARIFG